MAYFLGIDIGTTSTKAIAFSEAGEVVASTSHGYEMYYPQNGWMEQNPDEILAAVITGINEVYQKLSPNAPDFICFSAAMHSLIAVDANCNLLTQCIIWADNRADQIAENLKNSETGKTFYELSGVPIHSMSPLCKLLWLKENNLHVFETTHKFIGIKEYVFYKLFNQYLVDTSIASATGLLNIKTLTWENSILDYIGITVEKLPEIVSTKYIISGPTSASLSLPTNVPFVIGASDGALSNLGTGATGSNELTITIGTSSAARKIVEGVRIDAKMRTFCYHAKDDLYIIGGASNNGAVIFQWLKETLLQTQETFDELLASMQSIPSGSEGLLFLPYLLGERAPIWNSNAKGVFFGLTIQHTKAHLVKATVEGLMYSLYSIGQILAEDEPLAAIHATGGFAQNALGLQILADIFNTKVLVTGVVESSALGAVILGAEATQKNLHVSKNILAIHKPVNANINAYKKGFEKFERLYDLLKDEMNSV